MAAPAQQVIQDTPSAEILALIAQVNLLVADVAALKAAYDAHTHGGVTTGTSSTSAGPTAPAQTSGGVQVNQ